MVGLGAEYGFLGNWSAKVEYNYVDLSLDPRVFETGTQTDFFGVTTNISTTQVVYERFHIVKAGLNYRLGAVGGPETAPTAPASGYHWTGLYVGAQAAGDWAHADWIRLAPQNEYAISGWLGGAVVGVNAQAGAFVSGVEAELLGGRTTGGRTDNFVQSGVTITQRLATRFDGLAMATVRAGFVTAEQLLLYAKAGVAVAHARQTETRDFVSGGIPSFFFNEGPAMHTAGVAGLGAEYAFLGNWSAKLEYNYLYFRRQQVFLPGTLTQIFPGLGAVTTNLPDVAFIDHNVHLLKFGLNYHFGDIVR
jgi:outer membrane immunogenic protein